MAIDTKQILTVTEANQDFSKMRFKPALLELARIKIPGTKKAAPHAAFSMENGF